MNRGSVAFLVGVVGLVGCGDGTVDEPVDSGAEVGARDAVMANDGATGPRDVGLDVVRDAGADVALDRGVDTGLDVPRDVGFDVLRDATIDASRDAGNDTGVDASVDVPPTMPSGRAPDDAVPGAMTLSSGTVMVAVTPSAERVYRVEAQPNEHLGFRLDFAPTSAALVLRLERWDGQRVVTLGETDAGSGLRVLAALDASGPRTFFVRVRTTSAVTSARLTLTRTPFQDGSRCTSDCARLLQLPLRNDPRVDGYDHTSSTVLRYQFGRRDLVMFVRAAGQAMVAQGRAPFIPEDFSQWDGLTPGTDRGALRHASHQRGKDVDLSLYGNDGQAPWRSYCVTRTGSDGRECTPGTLRNYDALANVALFAQFFATGRVTMCFLDRELITPTRGAVSEGVSRGLVPAAVRGLYGDGTHLQHWPNHDNHIHVRVSEAGEGAVVFEAFEAP